MRIEAEDLVLEGSSGLQVALQELQPEAAGNAGSGIRCSDGGACCVENGYLHLLREELRSWPIPQGETPMEVAVKEDRVAAVLPDGRLLIWHEREGQLLQEGALHVPECSSILWSPGGRHLLCYGRQVNFFFLVEVGGDLRKLSLEVTPNDLAQLTGFVASATFRAEGDLLAAATESLSLWRWSERPYVSLASITPCGEKVLKLCFGSNALLALFPTELQILGLSLEPQRRLRFGCVEAVDVAPHGLALALGTRLAWLSLETSKVELAEMPEPLQRLALGSGRRLSALAQAGNSSRCCLLSLEPLLTRGMAVCLRQSYLKAWERSISQLPRSCSKQLKQRKDEGAKELLAEARQLHADVQKTAGGLDDGEALVALLPQVVKKLGERLSSEDGQLFHERFLAVFPVGDPDFDAELRRRFGNRRLREEVQRCVQQWCPAIREAGGALTKALEEAVLQSAASIASRAAQEAVQRLHRPPALELEVVRQALRDLVPQAPAALEWGAWHERLQRFAAPMKDSLDELRQEVAEAREAVRRLKGAEETSSDGISKEL